jgi:hypothetical protein
MSGVQDVYQLEVSSSWQCRLWRASGKVGRHISPSSTIGESRPSAAVRKKVTVGYEPGAGLSIFN